MQPDPPSTATPGDARGPGRAERTTTRTNRWVLGAAVTVAVVLTLGSAGYDYHRDELYFRMLPPDVGYVDQPPLTPWLARVLEDVLGPELWALRLPATLATAATVIVVAMITRTLGGGPRAVTVAAWGYAGAASTLMFGHVLLPATLDLLLWSFIVLAAARAALRDPRWWLLAGALTGATTANRWLVVVLAVGIAAGVLLLGPRSALRSGWLWAGVAASALLALPQLAYQVTNGWPQLAMGAALGDNNAATVRVEMWLLLVVLLGPPLLPVWIWGVAHLLREPRLRPVRFLVAAFVLLVAFTFAAGAQVHYFLGGLVVMFAAGCVPLGRWLDRRRCWRPVVAVALAVNAVVAVVLALPVLPPSLLGRTPVPDVSPLVTDQVGWGRYVEQVAQAYQRAETAAGGQEVGVITSNYGEAGAIARYGPAHGLPAPVSGHNHLHQVARPDAEVETVVLVGGQAPAVRHLFRECAQVDRLDNEVGVENEEQGQPILICHGPQGPWDQLWPEFAHLD